MLPSPRVAPSASRRIALRLGRGSVSAEAPPSWSVDVVATESAAAPGLDRAAVVQKLEEAGLPEAVAGARRISILVPDATRVARTDVYVPAIAEVLERRGVPASGVRVVLATGTHAAVEGDDRASLLGGVRGFEVVQHQATDEHGLLEVGESNAGTRIRLSRAALDADLVVLTGRVGNHYFAGFSGGPKAVLPGISGLSTVLSNHRKVLLADGNPDPRCANGKISDNPVHTEMRQAAALVPRPTFLANALVDTQGELREFFAGELVATHTRACVRCAETSRVPLRGTYDVVVASSGGHPVDGSLMQALKTPVGWAPVVRDGGVFVWVAGCGPAGLDLFRRWLSLPSLAELSAEAVRDYDLRAHNSVLLRRIASRVRLFLVSSLEREAVESLGFEWAPDLAAALAAAADGLGASARCLAVGSGNATYPHHGAEDDPVVF